MKPAAVFLALFLGSIAWSQSPTAPKVLIPLLAQDSHHQPIAGLTPTSLVISEDKIPVAEVSLLRGADLPLELGLVVDTSNSERSSNLEEMLKAAVVFATDALRRPEDRVFFLTFDVTPTATAWLNKEQLAGFSFNLRVGGGTALYDAVAAACKERMGPRDASKPTRRVLVVISDGDDNQSHITRDQAALEALNSGAVMFAISTGTQRSVRPGVSGEEILERWAKLTGGQFVAGLTGKNSPKIFAEILQLIDGIYYASYVSPNPKNKVREIEVKSASKEKLQLSYPRKYVDRQ